ncbi:MAG: hypothetical protein Q7J85_07110 [Bacillota bacterium]|nr:hypothetical protein [Bacillota bacterium]
MPNPSPWGGFMEGIAKGISGGTENYFALALKKIDRDDKIAEQRLSLGLAMYKLHDGNPDAQKDILQNFIAPSFDHFNNRGDASFTPEERKSFFDTFDPGSAPSKQLFKEFRKIDAAKNKGKITGTAAIDSFYKALEGYTGKLSETEQAGVKFRKERFEREEKAALFEPSQLALQFKGEAETAAAEAQPFMPGGQMVRMPSPTAISMGLTGPGQGEQMQGLIRGGESVKDARGLLTPKPPTEMELFQKDPGKYKAFKEAGRKAEEEKGITIAQKETRAQNFIKNYGPTVDKFDRIIEIKPEQRLPRLKGWFRTRELEKKRGYFTREELNQIEQTIMTGLRIEPKIQQNINLSRDQGATEEQIRTLLEEYLKGIK